MSFFALSFVLWNPLTIPTTLEMPYLAVFLNVLYKSYATKLDVSKCHAYARRELEFRPFKAGSEVQLRVQGHGVQ